MSLLVVVDGAGAGGELDEPKAVDTTTQTRIFSKQFPKAEEAVDVFDSTHGQDGLLHTGSLRKTAEAIIKHLHRSAEDRIVERIVFVAHSIGTAVVKQILLLASDSPRYQWIAFKTVGLHFVDPPSCADRRGWELFLLQLLAADGPSLLNHASLLDALPHALARIQVQFTAIQRAFDIELSNHCRSGGSWYLQSDGSVSDDLFLRVTASLRKTPAKLQTGYQDLLATLSGPDASAGRVNSASAHQESVTWLESRPSYESWLNEASSGVLGITGPPGSGSTYLSSHVLHSLLTKNPGPDVLFLTFSFYRWDSRRNSERTLVTSLIRQLLTSRPELYARVIHSGQLTSSQPSISCAQLWNFFRDLLTFSTHSQLFIILNAVDQCLQPIAGKVGLLTMAQLTAAPLKVLVTSSAALEMVESVSFWNIHLRDDGWSRAIREMAAERASRLVDKRPVWRDSQAAIVEKLCGGDYTYLYVMANLDILEQSRICSTRDALKQQLKTIWPIEKVFGIMVRGLEADGKAKLALNWIFHAVRPLTVEELAVAVELVPSTPDEEAAAEQTFDLLVETVSWDFMSDVGGVLGAIVKVTDGQVMLVHHTLRDYLKEHRDLLIPSFHASMADRCLSYLKLCSVYRAKVSMARDSLEQPHIGVASAFLDYAELYWPEHYKLEPQPNPSLDEKVSQFLTPKPRADEAEKTSRASSEAPETSTGPETAETQEEAPEDLETVQETQAPVMSDSVNAAEDADTAETLEGADALVAWVEKYSKAFRWEADVSEEPFDSLFLGTQLGLVRIVHNMLRAAHNTPERTGKAATIAARTGDLGVLEEVLKAAEPGLLRPALGAAAQYGRGRAIETLVTHMVESDVEASKSSRSADNPLLMAAANGHTAVVEALLSSGHGMQAVDEQGNTPVHHASRLGDVEMLLAMQRLRGDEFGAALTRTNRDDMLPLHLACQTGSIDAFNLVLNSTPGDLVREANPDSISPVQLAAESGYLSAVKKLIAAGADAVADGPCGTPLELAAKHGHYEVVCYLWEELEKEVVQEPAPAAPREASVTPTDPTETAVPAPELAADPSARESSLRKALSNSVENGHIEIVKFLLDKTSRDPDADRKHIVEAIAAGRLDILRALVSCGISAKPHTSEYNFWSLDSAISENNVDVVRYLVEEGVPAQWDSVYYQESSFHYAARMGRELCIREMLRGANVDDVRRKDGESRTALDAAANSCETGAFKLLLAWEDEHSSADKTTRPLRTLLWAVKANANAYPGKTEFVRFLLDNGWPANATAGSSEIPLHIAARLGDDDLIKLLLDRGADPKALDKTKETALHAAARHGATGAARILLARGADPNAVNEKDLKAPIHLAAEKGDNDMVRVLLGLDGEDDCSVNKPAGAKVDVKLKAKRDWTPLHYAHASSEVTSSLLEFDPKQDLEPQLENSLETPLILAAKQGPAEVVLRLLTQGASPHARDSEGGTALHRAATREQDKVEIVRYLTDHKADVDARMNDQSTPLYAAARNGNYNVVCHLLDKNGGKANPNLCGGSLHSPLQAAAFNGNIALVRRLLDADADAKEQGGSFGSALHAALWRGSVELVKLLLSRGASADLNIRPFGTPLHMLASKPSDPEVDAPWRDVTSLILEHGSAGLINVLNQSGRSALGLAVWLRPDEDDVQALLDLDAAPGIREGNGTTVLHSAANKVDPGLVQRLLAAGAKAEARDGCGRTVLYVATMSPGPVGYDDDDDSSDKDGSSDGNDSEAEGPQKKTKAMASMDVFDAVLSALPAAERTSHLAEALPAALKAGATGIFTTIIAEAAGLDVNVPDRSGWTALDVASSCGMLNEVKILQGLGAVEGTARKTPTGWSPYDRDPDVSVSEDEMEAWMEGYGSTDSDIYVTGIVRANHCMPLDKGLFYFEVDVLKCEETSVVAVGFLREGNTLGSLVGWDAGSWGYHSDDGSIINGSMHWLTESEYGEGATVGVAYDPDEKRAWFTLSGQMVGELLSDVTGQLYPAVSFQRTEPTAARVRVRFEDKEKPNGGFKFAPGDGLSHDK